jgi:hypothetical protein
MEKWKWKRCQKKGRRKIRDLVCGQYTNASKLGANWHEQDFLNHKTWSHFLKNQLIFFLIFYVVETCSKFSSWFQILHYSKDLIFWLNQLQVNHKSHVLQPIISIWKILSMQ